MPGIAKNTVERNTGKQQRNAPGNADSNTEYFKQAKKDIKNDPDYAPNRDPDEGELARFEGEE